MALDVRGWIERILFRAGFVVSRASTRREIAETIGLLKPHSCAKPLIRVGAPTDGGYLLPDDLEGVTALFSPGVGTNWSFETALVDLAPMPAFLCDLNVDDASCPFDIDPFWVGPSTYGNEVSLADWVALRAPDTSSDLLLQMDVEGAEYLTLLACPMDVLRRFRIIALELHGLHRLVDKSWCEAVYAPLLRKLASEFTIVHIHPNNAAVVDHRSGIDIPRTLEVTLYRNDRFVPGPDPVRLPHPLDSANVGGDRTIELSRIWTD